MSERGIGFVIGCIFMALVGGGLRAMESAFRGPADSRVLGARSCVNTAIHAHELENCRRYFEKPGGPSE